MATIYKTLVGILCVALVGCAKEEEEKPVIEADFKLYVEEFAHQAKQRNVAVATLSLTVKFDDAMTSEVGHCKVNSTLAKVTIKRQAWATMSTFDREALIFHELGHCLLRRPHLAELNADGKAKSIMYPSTMSGTYYSAEKEILVNELFTGK
ncbi:MAG: hypothetical protein SGI74_00410 [Oligoflexia bacterium]|nr:hypothetical protein [Oligoflexia bacterium]